MKLVLGKDRLKGELGMAKFEDLQLSESVMKAVRDMKFESPTPIQEQAIPLLFQGEDIIGQAKTGTGKTAAFGIFILEGLDYELRKPQVLILTPTRELCMQVRDEVARLGKYTPLKIVAVYGGQEIEKQLRAFREGVHVVVGTPGRVIDHLKRGTLSFADVGLVVIDEADRMLDMGFIDDMEFILANTPKERQTLLFSATMPDEIKHLAEKYMHGPQHLKVSEDETPVVTHIQQDFIAIDDPRDRLYALLKYLQDEKPSHTMIFCRTKFGADKLGIILRDRSFRAECLHGDMTQNKRDSVMKRFRAGEIDILVATDLAARGLDISDVSHVVNYNIPEDHIAYTHRVGRTGRMGKAGSALTLVTKEEMGKLGDIERALSVRMKERKHEAPERQTRPPMHKHTHERKFEGPRKFRTAVPHTYNL